MPTPTIIATSLSATHSFSKSPQLYIRLEAGIGVQGDAHAGPTTQHIYIRKKDPTRRNLTQVHLIHAELLDALSLEPGQMGENLTTRHLDLHSLPVGTRLDIGTTTLEITGYRTPCSQINGLRPGLMNAVFTPSKQPNAGIMAIVLTSGDIHPGDPIHITLPPLPHRPLGPV
ncbi:MOSC domain-containing protein [Granulicella sibirica]|uniref:MOSC domain protein n=1 Tax=Granulicella sibirica TaxID=2479048 RepID=A0A4Q0T248_9BACT|nr:MOSC domain-containing protein [Granulicella sibirica]RXH56058.1 MOSC domain protein [Granulicella sibirica]